MEKLMARHSHEGGNQVGRAVPDMVGIAHPTLTALLLPPFAGGGVKQ